MVSGIAASKGIVVCWWVYITWATRDRKILKHLEYELMQYFDLARWAHLCGNHDMDQWWMKPANSGESEEHSHYMYGNNLKISTYDIDETLLKVWQQYQNLYLRYGSMNHFSK